MSSYKFESDRLKLREFSTNDFSLLHSLDSDPEVMKYIANGVPQTDEEIRTSLARIVSRYGEWNAYGRCAPTV